MRPSRLLTLAAVAVLSLSAVAVAGAMRAPVEDGTLSVRDGRATITLRIRGGVIGRFARGQLTVTDPQSGTETVIVRGAHRARDVNERTTIYSGTNVRFRIADDRRVVVKLHASKINFSAVGRGDAVLDGWGDREGIYFDGSYSLNGEEYKSIPDERVRIELAAPRRGDG